jgi:hypothetical protein
VFDNRELRGMFGPKAQVLAGDWRKLHNENFHDLYPSPNIRPITLITSRKRNMYWGEYKCTLGFIRKSRKKEIA